MIYDILGMTRYTEDVTEVCSEAAVTGDTESDWPQPEDDDSESEDHEATSKANSRAQSKTKEDFAEYSRHSSEAAEAAV